MPTPGVHRKDKLMTVEFRETAYPIPPANRNDLIAWLQSDKVDDDLDVKAAAVDTAGNLIAKITQGWHQDKEGNHITVEVWMNGKRIYTAHVYDTGHITGYS
jgi:hypothetical protein